MSYPYSVEYLYALGNEVRAIKFGLEGIRILLTRLNDPQLSFRTIHVAGTNGKGSTCAVLESILRSSGLSTGLYTSPHLVEPTERIVIAGKPVTREQFAAAFSTVHNAAEDLIAAGRLEDHPTYFETVTAMAFLLFREAGVDVVVVETGLGGRLDATNVVSPRLCVITPVDFDHEAFLGNTLQSIASEKAGILKPGTPAVFSSQRAEADQILTARALELNCPIIRAEQQSISRVEMQPFASSFEIDGLPLNCNLAGEHQIGNVATAVAAAKELELELPAIQAGVAEARWPGRLEKVSELPEIVLDGAHNPAGARALVNYIRRFHAGRRIWLVYGTMRDKSVEEITEMLFPLAERLILTAPSQPRAVRPEVLQSAVHDRQQVEIEPDVSRAMEKAKAAPTDAIVFVTGSLYLVGEARAILVK